MHAFLRLDFFLSMSIGLQMLLSVATVKHFLLAFAILSDVHIGKIFAQSLPRNTAIVSVYFLRRLLHI